jgi:PAS domain S-box-containing protein
MSETATPGPGGGDAALWRTIVEQSQFSTVIYAADGTVRFVNDAFLRLWSVARESVPERYCVFDDPELLRHGVVPLIRRAFAGEAVTTPPIPYDISQVSASGTGRTIWTQGHLYPIRDADGSVRHVVLTHIDLTERLEAEALQAASDRRFAAIVAQTSAGIAQTDPHGRFVLVNDRYCTMLGRPREELLEMRMQDVTHPDDLPANLPLFKKLLATGEPFTIEKRYRRGDGAALWVSNSVSAIRDADGRVDGVLAVSLDISERVRAQQALQLLADMSVAVATSLELDDVLGSLAALVVPGFARWSMVYLAGPGGTLSLMGCACAAAEKVDDVRRLAERLAQMPPGERNALRLALYSGEAQLIAEIDSAFMAGLSADAEYRRLIGRLAPTSLIAVPLQARGEAAGVLICVTDQATRRYDAQDRTLAVELARRASVAVENAQLYRAERTARQRTARLQQITSRMAALLPAAEVGALFTTQVRDAFEADTAWLGVLSDDRAEFVAIAHAGFAERGIAPWLRFPADAPVPSRDVVADGRPRWFASAAEFVEHYPAVRETIAQIQQEAVGFLPLQIDDRVIGVMTLGFRERRDLSEADREFALALARQCAQALERARLYEAERAARSEADAANRAKSDFLAKMSHELRTPLNAIAGYADLIEIGAYGAATAEQRNAVARIQMNQRHLLGLINEILDFSKIEAGVLRLDVEPLDAREVVTTAEEMMRAQMHRRGIDFNAEPGAVPLLLRGDRERVVQICLNLLSNAAKATAVGGHVTLRAERQGERIAIRVRDTGVGIAAEEHESIFAPFTQLGRTLARPGEGGTGLGLAISRELARAMGGDLGVESQPGEGSAFTLWLPAADG